MKTQHLNTVCSIIVWNVFQPLCSAIIKQKHKYVMGNCALDNKPVVLNWVTAFIMPTFSFKCLMCYWLQKLLSIKSL